MHESQWQVLKYFRIKDHVLEMKQNSKIFQCVAMHLVFFPDELNFHSRANRLWRNSGVANQELIVGPKDQVVAFLAL